MATDRYLASRPAKNRAGLPIDLGRGVARAVYLLVLKSVFISLSFGCKLSPSPLLLEGGPTRTVRVGSLVPCFGVWIIEFIIERVELK